jgi:uncharacterized protein (DUF779 family)
MQPALHHINGTCCRMWDASRPMGYAHANWGMRDNT